MRNIDELNLLFYKDYFEPMALSEKQKEDRIKAAIEFEELLFDYIITVALDNEFDIDSDTKEVFIEEYSDAVKEFIDDDDFVELYVVMLANFLEETTIKHKGQEYYTSYQRALELSAGEASNVLNRKDYKEAVKDGKHYKIWQSFHDEKVRATHEALDGEIKPIDKLFNVGAAIMRFPHDIEYADDFPEETCNCRCSIDYF